MSKPNHFKRRFSSQSWQSTCLQNKATSNGHVIFTWVTDLLAQYLALIKLKHLKSGPRKSLSLSNWRSQHSQQMKSYLEKYSLTESRCEGWERMLQSSDGFHSSLKMKTVSVLKRWLQIAKHYPEFVLKFSKETSLEQCLNFNNKLWNPLLASLV